MKKILGQSMVAPGLCALISNLISSHSFKDEDFKKENCHWKSEYCKKFNNSNLIFNRSWGNDWNI